MMQRPVQDSARLENSLFDAVIFAHYLWIRLLATPFTTRQAIDLYNKYSHAQKLIRLCQRTGRAAGKIRPGSATATFAHLLWIRLCARLLRLVNPIDFKELFFDAQKCGNPGGLRQTATAIGNSIQESARTRPDGLDRRHKFCTFSVDNFVNNCLN